MVDKKEEVPDFSEFWFKIQRSNGDIMSAPLFEEKRFTDLYGEEAKKAFRDYMHYTGNPPTNLRGRKRLQESIEIILDTVEIHPGVILGGSFTFTRIEDA